MQKLSLVIEAVDRVTKPLMGIVTKVRALNSRLKLDQLVAAGRNVGKAFANMASEAARMARLVTAAAGLAGAGIFAMVKRAADAGDAVAKMSRSVGANAQWLQRLGYAAELNGSSLEVAGKAVQVLNKRVVDAATGNKTMIENFRRLGIQIKDTNGKLKPTDVIFGEIADKFASMPDGAKKTALAMAIFGDEIGAMLIPLLNLGSRGLKDAGDEADRFGNVMGDDALKASEDFNDGLSRLFRAISGVQNAIAAKLMPILTPLIQQFTNWIAANRELIATKIGEFVAKLPGYISGTRAALAGLMTALSPVISGIRALVEWIGPANTLLIGLGLAVGGKLLLSVVQLGLALVTFSKALGMTSAALARIAVSLVAGLVSPIGLAVAAAALIAGAVYLIYRNWDAVGPWFKRLWDNISGIFQGFIDFVAGVFTGDFGRALDGVKAMVEGYVGFYTTLWDGVKGVFTAFTTWVSDTFGVDLLKGFETVWNWISPIFDKIGGAIALAQKGAALASKVGGTVSGAVGGAVDAGKSVLSRFGAALGIGDGESADAANVPLAGAAKVDTGGRLELLIRRDGRVDVLEARPNDPSMDWAIDNGAVMAP